MNEYSTGKSECIENIDNFFTSQIKDKCTILEFGTIKENLASHLKNIKHCDIYRVQSDSNASNDISNYKHVITGQIEDYSWCEIYDDLQFDVIMLIDVLEHLYDPWKLLSICKNFLKPQGVILLSIHNIAYSAIFPETLEEGLEYNNLTWHNATIRFFTKKTLDKLIHDTGFIIKSSYHNSNNKIEFEESTNKLEDIGISLQRDQGSPIASRHALIKKEEEFTHKQQELVSLLNSRSWRFTKPLRFIGRVLRKIRNKYFPFIRLNSRSRQIAYFPRLEFTNLKHYKINETKIIPYSEYPLVSIIIPAYNQWEYTYNCISSIIDNTYDIKYEVILADDNSSDNTINAANIFKNIKVSRNQENLGFLRNCNNAAKNSLGKYLVFLNNDTQVMPHWLDELVATIEHDDNIGLVGSKLVYEDGRLQEAGGIIWQDGNGWNYGRLDDPEKPEYNYVKEVDYISGASILIRKNIWDQLKGFDEQFAPAYCEDSDLCFSIRQLGYKVVYQPFSVAVHFEGISHGRDTNSGLKQYQIANSKKLKLKWQEEFKKQAINTYFLFLARDRSLNKKTVVVIDHYVPTFDKDAGSKTVFNFLESLVSLGFNVKFIGDNFHRSEPYTRALQKMGIEVLYGSYYDQNWSQYLIKNASFIDYFILNRSHISLKYLKFIRKRHLRGKVIYYGHDLSFRRMQQEFEITGNKKLLFSIEKYKRYEHYMYNNADVNLTCSVDEQTFLSSFCNKPVVLVPAYFFAATNALVSNKSGLIFVGGFRHFPNEDAVLWFLDHVYTELDKDGVIFRIVGSNIPEKIWKYKSEFKHLELYSDVSNEELANLYSISKVAVAPLRFGAGVKGKVIEAMSKGLPVIGTSTAYEGLPNIDEIKNQIGVCDTPDRFKNEVYRLLKNENLWHDLSEHSTSYVKENFSREKMVSVFKQLII